MAAIVNNQPKPFDGTTFDGSPWCVVLGDPGSGKSTSLKKLLLDYTEQAQDQTSTNYSGVPIYIPLRAFAREHYAKGQGYALLDFIYDYAKGVLSASCSHRFFEHFLDAGECLICFDGLDEVVVPGQRQEVQKLVEAFIRRYPRNRYIVTSRIVGYDEAPLSSRLFPHYIVQPLSKEDVNTYVHKWYSTREKSQSEAESRANELFDTIMKSQRLQELASNPLLLAIIALVHRIEAELPHERVKLYDKCSEALLTTFESVKRLERTDFEKEYYRYRREILESVAFWMQAESATNAGREVLVSEADLQRYVAQRLTEDPTYQLNKVDAWQQAESFIKLMKERTGLLIDRGEKQFGFIHLTFQEYFTASYILRNYIYDREQMWKQIESHLIDPAWREVILLLLGKLNEFMRMPSMIVERILANPDEEERILRLRLNVATACIADHIRLDTSLQSRIVAEWVDIIRSPLCREQADKAKAALATIKQNGIVKEVMQQLSTNPNEPSHLRIDLASLYSEEGTAPDWVFETLSKVVCDQTASRNERRTALQSALKLKSHTDKVHDLILKLMKMDSESIRVCADVFIRILKQDELKEYFFPREMHSSNAKPKQAQRKSIWKKQDFDRFVKADSRFIIIFGAVGRNEYWPHFVKYSSQTNEVSEHLIKLLENNYKIEREQIPKQYQKKLIKALTNIAKHYPSYLNNFPNLLYWLASLSYPANALFDFVMEMDPQYDQNKWDILGMIMVFLNLLSRYTISIRILGLEEFETKHKREINKKDILRFNTEIINCNDFPLKFSYFVALSAIMNFSVFTEREFMPKDFINIEMIKAIQIILENISDYVGNDNFNANRFIGVLFKFFQKDKDEEFLQTLLRNAQNQWIRFETIKCLYKWQSINSGLAKDKLLEIATQEKEDRRLRIDATKELASLGAVDQAILILREMIMDTSTDEAVKRTAFSSLESIYKSKFSI